MSADTVDDLHAAEGFAGLAVEMIQELLKDPDCPEPARKRLAWLVSLWGDYCRPTCGAEGDVNADTCQEGPETCGCPCCHGD